MYNWRGEFWVNTLTCVFLFYFIFFVDMFYGDVDAVDENGEVHDLTTLLEGKEVCKWVQSLHLYYILSKNEMSMSILLLLQLIAILYSKHTQPLTSVFTLTLPLHPLFWLLPYLCFLLVPYLPLYTLGSYLYSNFHTYPWSFTTYQWPNIFTLPLQYCYPWSLFLPVLYTPTIGPYFYPSFTTLSLALICTLPFTPTLGSYLYPTFYPYSWL